jgi:peptide/nickel transport system substrate-binding protein
MIHDPEGAKKILAELGYSDTDGDGVMEKNDQPLCIEIVARRGTPKNMRIAELLKKRFARIGVALKIKSVDNVSFRQISERDRSAMMLLGHTTPWGMMMWAGGGSGYFDSRYSGWANVTDPSFHTIVDRMNTTLDTAVYQTAVADLQKYYAEKLPAIPLYWNVVLQPYRRCLVGWKISPMYGFLWEETWFHLKKEE